MHQKIDYEDLIGKPFEEIKCWELVEAMYFRRGVQLPSYEDMQVWVEVFEPTLFDILAFSLQGLELDHVGIYVGDGQFIHATEGNGVCIERLSRYKPKLRGIYRYKEA